MFLKVTHGAAVPEGAQTDATYSLYDDVTSCHFRRDPDGSAWANIFCREPVKTAAIEGFAEVEKNIQVTGAAYLLNNQGRTIDKFILYPFGKPNEIRIKPVWWGEHDFGKDGELRNCECGATPSAVDEGAIPKTCEWKNHGNGDGKLTIAMAAPESQEMLDRFYLELPYWIAAGLKRLAMKAKTGDDLKLLHDFHRLKIAEDVR